MQQIPVSLLTLLAGVLVTLFSLWVGQHHGLLPEQASEQAPLVDKLFSTMVTIGTALFIVVQGTMILFMWRYRKPEGDETDGVHLEGNLPLEIVWTAIPAVIVIGLGIYGTDIYQQMGGVAASPLMGHDHGGAQLVHQSAGQVAIAAPLPPQHSDMNMSGMDDSGMDDSGMDAMDHGDQSHPDESADANLLASAAGSRTTYGITESKKSAELVVNVTGLQFAWIFNYPEQGITAGELHVPIGKEVQLNLSAQDVIHSFWVPQFRLKQDAIPGEHTELRFKAIKVGEYPVVCAELCGSYHGSMRTRVIVHTPEAYEQWQTENKIAQQSEPDLQAAIAVNPKDLSDSAYLAPYAQEIGAPTEQLMPAHLHSSDSL